MRRRGCDRWRADTTGRTSVVDGPVVEIDVMLDPEKLRRVAVD
jgi:hypothetical protein